MNRSGDDQGLGMAAAFVLRALLMLGGGVWLSGRLWRAARKTADAVVAKLFREEPKTK